MLLNFKELIPMILQSLDARIVALCLVNNICITQQSIMLYGVMFRAHLNMGMMFLIRMLKDARNLATNLTSQFSS